MLMKGLCSQLIQFSHTQFLVNYQVASSCEMVYKSSSYKWSRVTTLKQCGEEKPGKNDQSETIKLINQSQVHTQVSVISWPLLCGHLTIKHCL